MGATGAQGPTGSQGAAGTGNTLVRKPANEDVISSTTFQNDDHLVIALAANEIWEFEAYVICTTNNDANPDIKWTFTVPTGASINWVSSFQEGSNAIAEKQIVTATATSITNPISAGTPTCLIKIRGFVANGANAGSLQFQWAQVNADTSYTRVQANSFMKAGRF